MKTTGPSLRDVIVEDIRDTAWDAPDADQDWRRFVPDRFRQKWDTLSDDERYVVYVLADEDAAQFGLYDEPD